MQELMEQLEKILSEYINVQVYPVFEIRNQRVLERNELVEKFNTIAHNIVNGTYELVQGMSDIQVLEFYQEWESRWMDKFDAFDAKTKEMLLALEAK